MDEKLALLRTLLHRFRAAESNANLCTPYWEETKTIEMTREEADALDKAIETLTTIREATQ